MKLGLRYRQQPVTLYAGTEITWEVEDDILDFSSLGAGYSWPITLPRDGNEHIFHHGGDPDHPDNRFRTYDGFQILVGGNAWWSASFILEEATDTSYSGSLSTVNSRYYDHKDRSIRDILTGKATFTATGLDTDAIKYPRLHYYNCPASPGAANPVVNTGGTVYVPCFRALYIIEQCLESIGMSFDNKFTVHDDDIYHLILVHNISTTFTTNLPMEDFIPDITLGQLISDICVLSASFASIDPEDNTRLILTSFERMRTRTQKVDLKDKLAKPGVSRSSLPDGVSISYTNLNKDVILKQTLPQLEGNYVGVYLSSGSFEASTPSLGDYAYCRGENAYYKVLPQYTGNQVDRYQEPFRDRRPTSARANSINLQVYSLPASKQKYAYLEAEGSFKIVNGSGKIRIEGDIPAQFQATYTTFTDSEISFVDAEDADIYGLSGEYLGISSLSSSAIVSTEDWSQDVTLKKLILRIPLDYYLSVIGAAVHRYKQQPTTNDFIPRLLIYRPDLLGLGAFGSYDTAFSDIYDARAAENATLTRLGQHNLQWHGADSLYDGVIGDYLDFIHKTRSLSFEASSVSITDLLKFARWKGARWLHGDLIFRGLRVTFSETGLTDLQLIAYKL